MALHRRSRADVTIATLSVSREEAQRLGIARINHATGEAPPGVPLWRFTLPWAGLLVRGWEEASGKGWEREKEGQWGESGTCGEWVLKGLRGPRWRGVRHRSSKILVSAVEDRTCGIPGNRWMSECRRNGAAA